jgi:transcriptional regulator with GAF, ATPase, and Fis domain
MSGTLLCWLGHSDLRAAGLQAGSPTHSAGEGPIARAVAAGDYDEVVLLSNSPETINTAYEQWLVEQGAAAVRVRPVALTSPTDFGEIHRAAVAAVTDIQDRQGPTPSLVIHLSPGTPAMAAVWILLSKTRFGFVTLIESSREAGVKTVSIPYDISVEFLADLQRKADTDLLRLTDASPPVDSNFQNITFRSVKMGEVVHRAHKLARRADVPVLLYGESGTGKELFARAIHKAGPRRDKPFQAVNCGAIPQDLMESELFGHERGAFTGADRLAIGKFEAAHEGTIFLDEIGELPLPHQVKLLRVLQEGTVNRLGSTQSVRVDVRIICATHRDLPERILAGAFREDLYYRVAVGLLKIPSLRDREGDVGLLIDTLLGEVNSEAANQPGYLSKTLLPAAKNALLSYQWPGNVRELKNTLTRVAIWTDGHTISDRDIGQALRDSPALGSPASEIPLGDGFCLTEHLAEIEKRFVQRAWTESNGRIKDGAALLGFPNYQNFTDRLRKYDVRKSRVDD